MYAMLLPSAGSPLKMVARPDPDPAAGELRLQVLACGVCRTDLHLADGDLPIDGPVVPGHEIIGRVEALGPGVTGFMIGDRVGVPWLGHTCGACVYCAEGSENLCDTPQFTGWTRDGGYADMVIADARYCFVIPDVYSDVEAAPLMCAGLIGYRCWRKACESRPVAKLGLYGFGAAAHLLAQLAIASGQSVFAFTTPGDEPAQVLAETLGCRWAGGSNQPPPAELDAAIIFAPVGELAPIALGAVRKGGTVVCGGIHMSQIPSFPYSLLWQERRLVSVANLTRQDAEEYLPLAAKAGVRARTTTYPLIGANKALDHLRNGRFTGAAVLVP